MIRKLLEFCIAAAVLAFLAGCLQGQLLRFSSGESVRVPECISEQNGIEDAELVLPMQEEQSIFPVILLAAALFLMSGCISRELVPRTSF